MIEKRVGILFRITDAERNELSSELLSRGVKIQSFFAAVTEAALRHFQGKQPLPVIDKFIKRGIEARIQAE
jgi:hypothetical protein